MARQGILVDPYKRLNEVQIEQVHRLSMEILSDPGIICFNKNAVEIFAQGGAEVISVEGERLPHWILKIPEKLIMDAIEAAPKVVKLGARNEDNCLI
ncbi:trimethylamine methyltransferase family protein, partial [Chloroflexota bacterium]